MRIRRMIVHTEDIQGLGSCCKSYTGSQYTCETDDMIVLGSESFRLRTSSSQWEMTVLKRIDKSIQVDALGTGGGSGLLNFSWGSERSFVQKMMLRLREYCEMNGLEYQEITTDLPNKGEKQNF